MPHEKENASSKHCVRGDAADDYDRSSSAMVRAIRAKKRRGRRRGNGSKAGRGVESGIVTADGNVKGFYLAEGIYK